MSTRIDRVHFEERQYLRSYDWTAEQLYHMEMRRRLNMALHLWGIVAGLDVIEGPGVAGLPKQFVITRGMAIDAFGREIVLGQDYVLGDDDVRRNRIPAPAEYWLSVVYRRELTTPPAPGYRLCDQKDQYTRWHESFAVLITPLSPTPAGADAPGVADPLFDDPVAHPWPVVVGKVAVEFDAGKLTITAARAEQRVYVGVRAQRLVAPVTGLQGEQSALPITVEADLRPLKNLEVGEGFGGTQSFTIDKSKVKPAPTATPFPAASGTAKIAADLFVRGEIYKYAAATQEFLALKESFAQLVPDVQVKVIPITTAPSSPDTGPSTGLAPVSFKTRLRPPSKADLAVAIAEIKERGVAAQIDWLGQVGGDAVGQTVPVQLAVEAQPNPTVTQLADGTQYDFNVKWTVGPTSPVVNPTQKLRITDLQVTCIAVFLP